jgi:ATP-dependent helicase/nuclease subunit B
MDLLEQLDASTRIITPNQRLAATLQQQHNKLHKQQARLTPKITPIAIWLNLLWQDYIFKTPLTLLTASQEQLIWREIITSTSGQHNILNPKQTAKIANQAFHSLKQWRLDPTDEQLIFGENCDIARKWSKAFVNYCRENKLIDSSTAWQALSSDTDFLADTVEKKLIIYNFLELSPAQSHLVQQLKKVNIIVERHRQENINTSVTRLEFIDNQAEISHMARWAKKQLNENKDQHIACVVPNLHQSRQIVLREFKKAFSSDKTLPIDISAGSKLKQQAIISSALNYLSLFSGKSNFDNFSALLRSSFFSSAESDMAQLHELDAQLRKSVPTQISLKELTQHLKFFDAENALANNLTQAIACFESLSKKQTLHYFSEKIMQLLKLAGWPGERTLNSEEFQASEALIKVIRQLNQFNLTKINSNYGDAMMLINYICQEMVFQPQTEKAPIQILGVLEALGMSFDKLMVIGLDDLSWPTQAKPNPFIPYQLQREKLMPHANAERELIFCKQVTQTFINDNKDVIFSSPLNGENKQARASLLIKDIPLTPSCEEKQPDTLTMYTLEQFKDWQAPQLSDTQAQGGTEIIRQQALCPFMAFAHLRLKAQSIEEPIEAFDAMLQGSLVHKALEFFWQKLKSQEQLLKLDDLQQETVVAETVDLALADSKTLHIMDGLISLERKRLIKLLNHWLTIEKQRHPFSVIETERTHYYQTKYIAIRMKIDRIDQLNNNSRVIIDYKTGATTIASWFGSRPKEPQLPIYCLSQTQDTSGIMFAQLKANNMQFKGLVRDEDQANTSLKTVEQIRNDHKAESWDAQIASWKNSIDKLAHNFYQGDAAADPVDVTACAYCDLHSLCRINDND